LQVLKKKEVDFNTKLEKELTTLKNRYPKLREKWQKRFKA